MKGRSTTYGKVLLTVLIGLWTGSIRAQAEKDSQNADTITDKGLRQTVHSAIARTEPPLDTAIVDSLLRKGLPKRKTPNFRPDPTRSMWLALVIPGGGQIYNRKLWKLPIVYGGFLGCAYALTWNNQMLRDYSQAYIDIMDNDPNTKSYEAMLPMGYNIEGKEERFKTIFKNKKDHYRKYRDMSILAFVGVYLISVIDAYVDAELSTFDISRDLSLHLEPAVINTGVPTMRNQRQNSYGLSCSLTF